jgi:hypothetical protein
MIDMLPGLHASPALSTTSILIHKYISSIYFKKNSLILIYWYSSSTSSSMVVMVVVTLGLSLSGDCGGHTGTDALAGTTTCNHDSLSPIQHDGGGHARTDPLAYILTAALSD